MMVTRELGEKRIIELISKESEYGEVESARLRLIMPALLRRLADLDSGLPLSREFSKLKWNSVLANELASCPTPPLLEEVGGVVAATAAAAAAAAAAITLCFSSGNEFMVRMPR